MPPLLPPPHSLTYAPPACGHSWIQVLEQNGTIEKFIPMDFSDADTVFDRCLAVSGRGAQAGGG